MYPRIGNAKGIVSNIHTGGYSLPMEYFLMREFDDIWEDVHNDLVKCADSVPYYYQTLLKSSVFDIGLDVGIQKLDGSAKLWIFEANSFPGAAGNLGKNVGVDTIIACFEYYHYLYDHFVTAGSEL
jgi:hypothetical protein